MLHKSVLSACKKAGMQVTEYKRTMNDGTPGLTEWCARGTKRMIQWYASSPDAYLSSVYVIRYGAEDDLVTDYFAGSFIRQIKHAIEWANA